MRRKLNQREIKSLFSVMPVLEFLIAEYLSHNLTVHCVSVWFTFSLLLLLFFFFCFLLFIFIILIFPSQEHTQRKDLWTGVQGEGKGGTNGKSCMETNTLPYVKQLASENLLYNSGSSSWCSVTTQRDRIGQEGGSGGRGHRYTFG